MVTLLFVLGIILVFAGLTAFIVHRIDATRVELKARYRDVFDFSLLADSSVKEKELPPPAGRGVGMRGAATAVRPPGPSQYREILSEAPEDLALAHRC